MLTEGETGQSRSGAAVGMCELGEGPFGEAEMWRLWMVLEENEVVAVCLCKQYLGAGAGFDILPQLRKSYFFACTSNWRSMAWSAAGQRDSVCDVWCGTSSRGLKRRENLDKFVRRKG